MKTNMVNWTMVGLAAVVVGSVTATDTRVRRDLSNFLKRTTPTLIDEAAYATGAISMAICGKAVASQKELSRAEISDVIHFCLEKGPMEWIFGEVQKWKFTYRYGGSNFPEHAPLPQPHQSPQIDYFRV